MVTGGTGLLGQALVPELTRRGHRVILPMRRASERGAEVAATFARKGVPRAQLVFVESDLDKPELGLSDDAKRALADVTQIFHLGARFAWGLTREQAHETNVLGSVRVVELAASLPRRPKLVLVGGYRLGPRRDRAGRVRVPAAADFVHAGAYEASKYHAHAAAVARAEALSVPYTGVHPSSVIGDSRTGESGQVTGLGESIVALARGALPARAFGKHTFVPLIPVDFVATVLAEVGAREETSGLELPLLDPATPRLDDLLDRAAARLSVRAPKLRVPTWLVRALPERLTQTSREALEFLDDVTYPADETDAFLARIGLVRPDIERAFDLWVDHLARTALAPSPAVGVTLPA